MKTILNILGVLFIAIIAIAFIKPELLTKLTQTVLSDPLSILKKDVPSDDPVGYKKIEKDVDEG